MSWLFAIVLAWIGAGLAILGVVLYLMIRRDKERLFWGLVAQAIHVGAGCAFLIVVLGTQFQRAQAGKASSEVELVLPAYDYAQWRSLPVQHAGRHKPFETAAPEILRDIHGRGKLRGMPAEAVVLSWILAGNTSGGQAFDWENFPFILCGHTDVRRLLYTLDEEGRITNHEPTQEQLHGKYVTPKELRQFRDRFRHADKQGRDVIDTLQQAAQSDLSETLQRLDAYDNLTRFAAMKVRGKEIDLLSFVALDQVKGAPWFSIRQLQLLTAASENWTEEIRQRVKDAPQLYIPPDYQAALKEFQEHVKQGAAQPKVDELVALMKQRREQRDAQRQKQLQEFFEHLKANRREEYEKIAENLRQRHPHEHAELVPAVREGKDAPEVIAQLKDASEKRDQAAINELQQGLKQAREKGYDPDDLQFRMFHLAYLENRFPDVYEQAALWQKFPVEDAREVLNSYEGLRTAYQTGKPEEFDRAARAFFTTVRQVSERTGQPYPGEETIADRLTHLVQGKQPGLPSAQLIELEMQFNKVQPFMWAWIVMFVSVLCFVVQSVSGSRLFYRLALGMYMSSLVLQVYGFFARIVLAGRPPVSNMYETVIWVAFTAGLFALVLELIYRKGLIGLAGSLVAWLGLVLADNLPVSSAFTSSISSLAPVLRSNFWLTIHVLVIVASYAGGALAWMLGNISLGMMTFGNPKREAIKTLTQYNYRALQIAVLLLALGTFLGGWWAAKSWGRFWGWDPKEVGALIALVCYVIPLHARFIGWVKDFGLAVCSVVCFSTIMMSWYGVNFILGVGLHAYAFGGGGKEWVFLVGLMNVLWVLLCCIKHVKSELPAVEARQEQLAGV